ncbi:Uncharacterised protein [Vibrio cholerae]|nr:Uncharacterised protein [Vibrio cholerae]
MFCRQLFNDFQGFIAVLNFNHFTLNNSGQIFLRQLAKSA